MSQGEPLNARNHRWNVARFDFVERIKEQRSRAFRVSLEEFFDLTQRGPPPQVHEACGDMLLIEVLLNMLEQQTLSDTGFADDKTAFGLR